MKKCLFCGAKIPPSAFESGDYRCPCGAVMNDQGDGLRRIDSGESGYDKAVTGIRQAIHLGISCNELPDWEPEVIDRLAAWLASEGIGKS